jgi:hypothetical protein
MSGGTGGSRIYWGVVAAAPGRIGASAENVYSVVNAPLPAEGLAAIEAVADWASAIGPETNLESTAVWSRERADKSPALTVRANIDGDTAGRTVDELADDLATRLAGSGAPYQVQVAVNGRGSTARKSG